MTDERLFELMGWTQGMKIEPGDMAYRVRALVVAAERDEREACAQACEAVYTGHIEGADEEYLAGKEMAVQQCVSAIRMRSNVQAVRAACGTSG